MREKSKPGYNIGKVIKNNAQRKYFDVWLHLDKVEKERLIGEEKRNLRDKRVDDLLKK